MSRRAASLSASPFPLMLAGGVNAGQSHTPQCRQRGRSPFPSGGVPLLHLFQRLFLTFAANIKCYMVTRRLFGFFCLVGVVVLLLGAAACEKVNDVLKSLGLSDTEIVAGLKEALNTAADTAQGSASKVNGFLKNEAIAIMLPDELKPVKQLVDKADDIPVVGAIVKNTLGNGVEDLRVAMNRAAEHASQGVLPIFKGAVKEMTITDGLQVLQGGDSAASHYLREKTYTKLEDKFTPVVKESMGNTKVNSYYETLSTHYNDVMGQYGAVIKPFVSDLPDKLDVDLSRFITTKGLDGLFYLMKGEEKKIRTNPLDYASDIIRKVFNSPEAREKKNG